MNFSTITAFTAGTLIVLQMLLMFSIMRLRMTAQHRSQEGSSTLQRYARRHGNLAENAAIFLTAFALLELGGTSRTIVLALCMTFVGVRFSHAIGMSKANIDNPMRGIGALGTLMLGLVTGALLVAKAAGVL